MACCGFPASCVVVGHQIVKIHVWCHLGESQFGIVLTSQIGNVRCVNFFFFFFFPRVIFTYQLDRQSSTRTVGWDQQLGQVSRGSISITVTKKGDQTNNIPPDIDRVTKQNYKPRHHLKSIRYQNIAYHKQMHISLTLWIFPINIKTYLSY